MHILVIHGPNLNMLGRRNQAIYGNLTLEDLYQKLVDHFFDVHFTFYQSNHEGDLIDMIQKALDEPYDGLLINPGGYTHTSIAIRDALEIHVMPKVEVHLSDITQRETFRSIDVISDVCDQRFMGKKIESYIEAIDYLKSVCIV